MNFEKVLNLGVEKEIINEDQKNSLLELFRENHNEDTQVPIVVRVFYYIGGLIMLGAMTALMSHTIQHTTYAMILLLGCVYAGVFFGVGEFLWRKGEKFPAGILYFLFITMISFIILDIEKMTGFFPHFSDMWKTPNYMEAWRAPVVVLSALTIIANTILLRFRKVSFLAVPTIACSYVIYVYMISGVLDLKRDFYESMIGYDMAFFIGLVMIAFLQDRITKVDYSKWMYLCGAFGILASFTEILDSIYWTEGQEQSLFFALCVIFVLFGLIIRRKPFLIIGILGAIEYIMYCEGHLFKGNTLLMTSVILITGLVILYAGVLYNKNSEKVENFIVSKFPEKVRNSLPQNRV